MIVIKNTKGNGVLEFREIDRETSKRMIVENHYSKKWNNSFGIINIGVFRDEKLLGVAVFGNLMNPGSYASLSDELKKGEVIELNRLWIDDKLGHNTETTMIAACFKIIKIVYPNIKCVQSFADGRLGCGTIYKASNFDYYGYNSTLFAKHKPTGNVFHHVSFENTKRPTSMMERWTMLLKDELEWFEVKTYRYIYWLNKKVKCKRERLSYPAYDKGETPVNHSYPPKMYARIHRLFKMKGMMEMCELAERICISTYDKNSFDCALSEIANDPTLNWIENTKTEFKQTTSLADLFDM